MRDDYQFLRDSTSMFDVSVGESLKGTAFEN